MVMPSSLVRCSLVFCLASLAVPAAAQAAEPIPEELDRGAPNPRVPVGAPPAELQGPATLLTGRLFYEDHRGAGDLDRRIDMDGEPGRVRRKRQRRRQDFLGADFMVVEVFERDLRTTADGACQRMAFIGQAIVQPDGAFSVPVPARETCPGEALAGPRYLIQVSTRHCVDDVCVRLGRTSKSTYTLWFGKDTPLVTGPAGVEQNLLLFSRADAPADNTHAMAANHFASLADVLQALHVEAGVPFRLDTYGPLQVRFPSLWADGRGTSATLIDINNNGWPKGNLMVHEYGHIVHRRAWNGDYAGFPDPIQSWNGTTHSGETPFIAFKEGFAGFVISYTTGRCFRSAYDERDDLASVERGRNGVHFPQNHRRALCDLVDEGPEHRVGTAVGEHVTLSVREVWDLIDQTDDLVGRYSGSHPVRDGLGMCDVAEVYLIRYGETPERVRELYGLLETNDIWCAQVTERFASLPVEPLAIVAPLEPVPDEPSAPEAETPDGPVSETDADAPLPSP